MKNSKPIQENSGSFKRYIGYGTFQIVCVNPNKAKLEELGIKVDTEPVYHGEDADKIPFSYIDVYLKKSNMNNDIPEFLVKVRFFFKKKAITSKDGKSVLTINNYGVTTFIPGEHAKLKTVPENLSWYKFPYNIAFEGQREFTDFLKAFFGIPNLQYKKADGTIVTIDNPSDAEVGLDSWGNLFKGDFSEIKILENYPENKVRILLGVKKTDDNKLYQDVFMQYFGKVNNTSTAQVTKKLEEAIANGRYSKTEFIVEEIREHIENSTASEIKEVTTVINNTLPNAIDPSIEMEESNDLPF